MPQAAPVDQRAQYAAWQAIHDKDVSGGGESAAADPTRYLSQLTSDYQKQYGAAPTDSFDWSPTVNSEAKAQMLLKPQSYANDPARAQVALAQAKKFDPNATLDNMGELQFDRSKLPAFKGGDLKQYDKYGGLVDLTTNYAGDRVKNQDYVIHDENYGDYTEASNLSQAGNDAAGGGVMGQLQTYMPTIIGSIMSMASGGLMSPQLVQAAAAASEGDWKGLEGIAPGLILSMVGGSAYSGISNYIAQQMQRQKNGA